MDIEISENKKTGNFFLAGGYDQDQGVGLSLGLSDDNILGSGNKIDSSLGFTSDTILFDVGLTQKPNITFRYNAFNSENDSKTRFTNLNLLVLVLNKIIINKIPQITLLLSYLLMKITLKISIIYI